MIFLPVLIFPIQYINGNRKTKPKIATYDEPSYIPMQMPRSQASSTWLNNKNPSSFQEGAKSNKKIRAGISPLEETLTPVGNLEQTHPVPGKNIYGI